MERILFVDDDKTFPDLVGMIFATHGELSSVLTPMFAVNAEEAFSFICTHNIPIVCSDIAMPDSDGLELLQKVKSVEETRYTIFLLCSAYTSLITVRQALSHGIFDFITKPFDNSDFVATILRAYNHYKVHELDRRKLVQLQKAADVMTTGITITSPKGVIIYTNPAEAIMHGYTVQELMGEDVEILAPQGSRIPLPIEHRTHFERQTQNRKKDGTVFPVRLISDVVKDSDGEVQSVITTCEDLSEQEYIKSQLQQTVEHLTFSFYVSRAIAAKMSVNEVIDSLLHSMVHFSSIQGAAFLFSNGGEKRYEYTPGTQISAEQWAILRQLAKNADKMPRFVDTPPPKCPLQCTMIGIIRLNLEIQGSYGVLFIFSIRQLKGGLQEALGLIRELAETAIQQAWIYQEYKELAELSSLAIRGNTERFKVQLNGD